MPETGEALPEFYRGTRHEPSDRVGMVTAVSVPIQRFVFTFIAHRMKEDEVQSSFFLSSLKVV